MPIFGRPARAVSLASAIRFGQAQRTGLATISVKSISDDVVPAPASTQGWHAIPYWRESAISLSVVPQCSQATVFTGPPPRPG